MKAETATVEAVTVAKTQHAGRRRNESHGITFAALLESGLGESILKGNSTQAAAAARLNSTNASISKAMAGIRRHFAAQQAVEDWVMKPKYRKMLLLDEVPDIADKKEFDRYLKRAVKAFVKWRGTFFRTPRGPYITARFHRRWIKKILKAIYTGGQLQILSPPRHGKSELLVHFCTWLIIRNPNIQILWVGGNEDIAALMVGMVKAQLEDNDQLRAAFLPPEHSWKPQGRGGTWRNDQFTVSTQDTTIVKSPTMVAVGRSGKILSRDADLIVSDDLEDHKSTLIPSARENTRTWFTQDLDSRKEEHTAWVNIGSHQHVDGLHAHLLNDENWEHVEDAAHDEDCKEDPNEIDDHIDCMLFPQLRTYRWLRKKQLSARALGLEAHYELVYLQKLQGKGATVFVVEDMEACRNLDRGIGLRGLPSDIQKIAGLDPSSTGYQAGFFWAFSASKLKLYLVDTDNHHGGGVDNALTLFKDWFTLYRLGYWVVEENGFQKAIRLDRSIKEWTAKTGVWLEPHETQGGNKHDPLFGVGGTSGLFKNRTIDLPYAGTEAREKTDAFIKQCKNFDGLTQQSRRRGVQSDILMASWFPMKIIRRWIEDSIIEQDEEELMEEAFAGFEGIDYGTAPW